MTLDLTQNFLHNIATKSFSNIQEKLSKDATILGYYIEEYKQNKIYESLLWRGKNAEGAAVASADETFIDLPDYSLRDTMQNIIL